MGRFKKNQPRSPEGIWPVRTASAACARTAARSAVDEYVVTREPAGSMERVWATVAASACTSARVRLVSNWVENCEASASSAWAPKEAKAATAAMERKRAVVFMMQILEVKKASQSEERRVGKECRSRWSPYH